MKQRIKEHAKRHHIAISIGMTALLCALSFIGAFAFRFDFHMVPETHRPNLWIGLPVMVLIRVITLAAFRSHRGLYRYVSMHDLIVLFQAVTVGSVAFAAVWFVVFQHHFFMPRSIYLLDWMLCLFNLVGVRAAVRWWRGREDRKTKDGVAPAGGRALIVGAGNLGESTLRMIDRRFLGNEIDVVGFVDSDSMKVGNSIHGVPVLGKPAAVPYLVREQDIGLIVFAISNPPAELFQQVIDSCDVFPVRFNTVSVLKDMATGEVSVDRMRGLRIEDLLGRDPVNVDPAPVRNAVAGRTVMVTGAGGSIGSELSRQLASYKPRTLVLLDSGETPLFEIDRELRQTWPKLDVQPLIADIKHADVVDWAFEKTKPDFVYHAAAYKHVPLMEAHPDEAVLNNVRGTRNVAEAARQHRCERFVMVSTDKAVRPSNVMGATKRMCELVVQSMNGGKTVFTAVRFGNVLGSNGSVIPIFKKQIAAGGPLTITHPEMTRFFMTIPEAVSLVLQCGVIAEPGDVFVLDMGTPVKILDLAKNMIRLSGLREDVDVSIKVTGLRPGEKMFEELVAYGEELEPTIVPKVNVLKQKRDGLCQHVLIAMMKRMEDVAGGREVDKTRAMLWRMIDLDNRRAQHGVDGLTTRDVKAIAKDWLDTVNVAAGFMTAKSKGRVLAVVGDLSIHDALSGILAEAGYELDCLDSSEEALKLLLSDQAYVALLCDLIMPREAAWKLRDKVRGLRSTVPVLAMSAYDNAMLTELLEIDPPLPVLRKPFDAREFEDLLGTTVHAERERQSEET